MTKPPAFKKYEEALKIARQGKVVTRKVHDLICAAHEEGDARATYAFATWLLFGTRHCKKDLRTAAVLLKQAAEADIADAAYDLAVSYEGGNGVRKSLKAAFRYYVQAALLGDAQSHYEIGRMYFWGIGTARDRDMAELWLAKAEMLGVTE